MERGKKIKALEQETCSDCISRNAVLERSVMLVDAGGNLWRVVKVEDIKALPPVTPSSEGKVAP